MVARLTAEEDLMRDVPCDRAYLENVFTGMSLSRKSPSVGRTQRLFNLEGGLVTGRMRGFRVTGYKGGSGARRRELRSFYFLEALEALSSQSAVLLSVLLRPLTTVTTNPLPICHFDTLSWLRWLSSMD
jgi:hypothetical protein